MEFIKSIFSRIIHEKSPSQLTIDYHRRFTGEATVIAVEPPKQRSYWVGKIAFAGSYWQARTVSSATLEEGDICEVIGNSNITLIIRPLSQLKPVEISHPFDYNRAPQS